MPEVDHSVACHQLTVSPSASIVSQRRRRQSPEKAETVENNLSFVIFNFLIFNFFSLIYFLLLFIYQT